MLCISCIEQPRFFSCFMPGFPLPLARRLSDGRLTASTKAKVARSSCQSRSASRIPISSCSAQMSADSIAPRMAAPTGSLREPASTL